MFTVQHGEKVLGERQELADAMAELVQECLDELGWTDLECHPSLDNSFHVWGIAAYDTDFSFTDVVVYWS